LFLCNCFYVTLDTSILQKQNLLTSRSCKVFFRNGRPNTLLTNRIVESLLLPELSRVPCVLQNTAVLHTTRAYPVCVVFENNSSPSILQYPVHLHTLYAYPIPYTRDWKDNTSRRRIRYCHRPVTVLVYRHRPVNISVYRMQIFYSSKLFGTSNPCGRNKNKPPCILELR
jgi:hypothetical protein